MKSEVPNRSLQVVYSSSRSFDTTSREVFRLIRQDISVGSGAGSVSLQGSSVLSGEGFLLVKEGVEEFSARVVVLGVESLVVQRAHVHGLLFVCSYDSCVVSSVNHHREGEVRGGF